MRNSSPIKSILRTKQILDSIVAGNRRLIDIAAANGLSKSTAHRLLKSMATAGFVIQDPLNRLYGLGPQILSLCSCPSVTHEHLITAALHEMKLLSDITGETVVLHLRMGADRICLEEIQSLHNLKLTAGKGYIAPLYTGSAGKILLSELADYERDLLVSSMDLVRLGPATIVDKELLKEELKKVKRQGFATSFGERVEGSASISVPVRGYLCPVALSILGPEIRFAPKMMGHLEVLITAAQRISEKLNTG
jgi:DNA-binding IclR family transcriptional regulator